MQQFVITAMDHKDSGAPNRRVQARQAHLERVHAMEGARVLSGGAVIGPDGVPIGSSMHAEFMDRPALDAWLADDPYVTSRVWDVVDVRPFRQALSSPSAVR